MASSKHEKSSLRESILPQVRQLCEDLARYEREARLHPSLSDPREPMRAGLRETPERVSKAYEELLSGYRISPISVLKNFEDGADGCDEMVMVGDLPVYSLCEHHLLPFLGKAYVAYIPKGRIVGLSKIPRLVEVFSRRLQVQERLTNQIADCLNEALEPVGVGVTLLCRHLCMEMRGVRAYGAITQTTALRGAIKMDHRARSEFLHMVEETKSSAQV